MRQVCLVRVFPLTPEGGNPAPIVLDAEGMTAEQMRGIAARYGHESGFVLPPQAGSGTDLAMRFFVPRHEMEMCGHATIGALWALRVAGRLQRTQLRIDTASGAVDAQVPAEGAIAITQPAGQAEILSAKQSRAVLDILGLEPGALLDAPLLNARTSRVKTLVPLRSRDLLDRIEPDFKRIETLCTKIASTGLYPFAPGAEGGLFHARQFPRNSGYPEDAATGIAASALAYGVRANGLCGGATEITVRQGEALGRPSEIRVAFDDENRRCWISGSCIIDNESNFTGEEKNDC